MRRDTVAPFGDNRTLISQWKPVSFFPHTKTFSYQNNTCIYYYYGEDEISNIDIQAIIFQMSIKKNRELLGML